MTDIVQQLRQRDGDWLCEKAADEIERLHGLLAWHDSTVPEILADNKRLREEIRILTLANKNLQAGLNVSDSDHG